MQRKFFMLTAMCVVALALPAWAHHSHNGYEVTVWTDLEGTVSELHLIVPHSWVYLDVEDDSGETITWGHWKPRGRIGMIQNGAKREDVQVGDRIKVRCHLLRGRLQRLPARVCDTRPWRSGARPRRRDTLGLAGRARQPVAPRPV